MTNNLTKLLQRLTELNSKRSPGEWTVADGYEVHCDVGCLALTYGKMNTAFIATLANELPKLLKIIQVQSKALETVKRADYVNVFDEHGEFVRMLMPGDTARHAQLEVEAIAAGEENK